MKQNKINLAYVALGKLCENEALSEKSQWKIYMLRKKLRPYVEFYDERMAMITKKYREFADEEGKIDGIHALNFVKDRNELDELDIDINLGSKPSIGLVKGIHCTDIEELEDFIEFVPPDD